DSEAYGSLVRLGRSAEAEGHDATALLRDVVQQGRLEDAKDLGKVLHWRLEQSIDAAERRQVQSSEQRLRWAVETQEATVTDLMGQLAVAPVAHVDHEVSDEAQAEAVRQAEAMQQAPVLAWNGSQEDALAAQQAVMPAQVIDPVETQRAAEAAAAEQAQQQAALDQAMAMQLGAEVLHGGPETQERHRIAEEHRQAAEERADWPNRTGGIDGPKGEYARAVAEI